MTAGRQSLDRLPDRWRDQVWLPLGDDVHALRRAIALARGRDVVTYGILVLVLIGRRAAEHGARRRLLRLRSLLALRAARSPRPRRDVDRPAPRELAAAARTGLIVLPPPRGRSDPRAVHATEVMATA